MTDFEILLDGRACGVQDPKILNKKFTKSHDVKSFLTPKRGRREKKEQLWLDYLHVITSSRQAVNSFSNPDPWMLGGDPLSLYGWAWIEGEVPEVPPIVQVATPSTPVVTNPVAVLSKPIASLQPLTLFGFPLKTTSAPTSLNLVGRVTVSSPALEIKEPVEKNHLSNGVLHVEKDVNGNRLVSLEEMISLRRDGVSLAFAKHRNSDFDKDIVDWLELEAGKGIVAAGRKDVEGSKWSHRLAQVAVGFDGLASGSKKAGESFRYVVGALYELIQAAVSKVQLTTISGIVSNLVYLDEIATQVRFEVKNGSVSTNIQSLYDYTLASLPDGG